MGRNPSRNVDASLHAAVINAWLATQTSANTRAAYRTDLATFGRWCVQQGSIPLRADTATLVAYQAARESGGDSASTLRRRWSSLSSFYQFAVDANSASSNPVIGAIRPKTLAGDPSPTAVLSPQSVGDYLAVAAALDPRLEALVSLLVYDGLKLGEALALDVNDITGRPPKVSLTIRRKDSSRRVTLEVASARPVYRCAGRRTGEPLFTSARQTSTDAKPHRLTRFGADHLIKQLTTPGNDRVTTNALRRFHFTASDAAGTDIDHTRRRGGLADIRSLRRYLTQPETSQSTTAPDQHQLQQQPTSQNSQPSSKNGDV